jgi:hypothetical protein
MMTKTLTSRSFDVQIKNLRSTEVSEGSQISDIKVGYTTSGLNNIFNRWSFQHIPCRHRGSDVFVQE